MRYAILVFFYNSTRCWLDEKTSLKAASFWSAENYTRCKIKLQDMM